MHFEAPWVLLLVLVVPLLVWLRCRRDKGAAVRFSTTEIVAASGKSARQRLTAVPLLLRAVAMVLVVVALARPQEGLEHVRDVSNGIAIEMVIDRSSSMGQPMEYEGVQVTRLEAVKRVFEEFVAGNDEALKGRPSDLVGVVTFARYPNTTCPLTLAHGVLPHFLKTVNLARPYSTEDGTAIGDGIALAAARLKTAEETMEKQRRTGEAKDYEIKSKIIILLTDGENNAGEREPVAAAELAAEWGIKVYVIGISGKPGMAVFDTVFGPQRVPIPVQIDEGMLTAIAGKTGGIYRRAHNAEALKDIYGEIDKLEKSEVESVRYLDYRERFLPFALAALILLVLGVATENTILRKVP